MSEREPGAINQGFKCQGGDKEGGPSDEWLYGLRDVYIVAVFLILSL